MLPSVLVNTKLSAEIATVDTLAPSAPVAPVSPVTPLRVVTALGRTTVEASDLVNTISNPLNSPDVIVAPVAPVKPVAPVSPTAPVSPLTRAVTSLQTPPSLICITRGAASGNNRI